MKRSHLNVLIAFILVSVSSAVAQPDGQVNPTSLNFKSVLVGSASFQMDVALKNTGNVEMTVSSVSTSGPFSVTMNRCGNGVKPGTHCNVWVTYNPQMAETDTGALAFTDNSSNSPQTVSLTGNGVAFET
jgi:hypothetical protein